MATWHSKLERLSLACYTGAYPCDAPYFTQLYELPSTLPPKIVDLTENPVKNNDKRSSLFYRSIQKLYSIGPLARGDELLERLSHQGPVQ